MAKTNAVRILDSAGINYDLLSYTVDENDLSAGSVAAKLGKDPEQVFKTLVLKGDRTGIFVCVIPGPCEVNLRKAALASGNKSVEMIHMKELLPLTGYIRGGCSPIAMKKNYPTYIDETALLFDAICISAGQRGLQITIKTQDLIMITESKLADLI
jgi:Cys-tRNA(Pro)/Cys-tRNA(Cys) deacylase